MRRISRLGVASGLAAVIVAGAGLAFASHGDAFIDLASAPELEVEHDGALFVQGGVGAGTGTFDPFLTANNQGSADTQSAINVCVDDNQACPDPQFDTFTGGGRTHHLNLAAVPELEIGGTLYREFSLDANDQGGEDHMSIDLIKMFLDTEKTAGDYDPSDDSFGDNTGAVPFLAWEVDIPILMRSQTFTPGSGVSDITVLVPSTEFITPEDCSYGSQDCTHFLYFYYEAGGTGAVPGFTGVNWNVTAGFEEWRTRLLPAVDVEKTADPSFDRDFDWTVTKEVSLSASGPWSDSESVDLFDGQSDTVYWRINVTKSAPQDSGQSVSGTITIFNPTGGVIIEEDIDAEILSVEDVIDGVVGPVAVDCGETFPFTLEPQETLVCTYSSPLPNGDPRLNTATVTIEDDLGGEKEYFDTEDIDFTGIDPTVTDDTADLTDALLEIDEEVSASVENQIESTDVDCDDEGTITNTAVITESDSGDFDDDDADVTITCYQLTVTKDATPAFLRTFDWTVTKEVSLSASGPWSDSESVDLFDGQSDTVYWRINVTKSAPIDSGYAVSGTITITNPAPIAAVDVAVSDALTGAIAATVDCDPLTLGDQTTVTVAASDSEACSYSATLPDDTTRTNTATASLAGEDYTGTAQVDFTGVTPTTTDNTADLTDALLAIDEEVSASVEDRIESTDVDCDDEGTITNTAVITESDSGDFDDDDASVTITCYQLTVTKDATPSFDRDWTWTIDKNADATEITINADESATITYEIDVSATHIDSGYAVSGTITITNPAPIAAVDVAVSDALTGAIAATVDCDPLTLGDQTTVTVAASDSETCSYSATLPDATTRTNTATASLAGEDYTGTAQVDFTSVTPTETDETIDVTDTYAGVLGQVTASPPDPFEHTFTYQRTVEGSTLLCGDNLIENTATFVTTDSGATASADEDVTITVICQTGQGCTPGFWQGGVGFDLWNVANDADFPPPGGNGDFTHDLLFNAFFTSHPSLDGLSMIDVVGTGGGNDPARRAARSLVAAYLNALADGVSYDYTTGELEALWAAAVAADTPTAFNALHNDLDEKNNLGADLCGFPEEETLEASALGAATIALTAWLLLSAAWRGRHGRRLNLLDD